MVKKKESTNFKGAGTGAPTLRGAEQEFSKGMKKRRLAAIEAERQRISREQQEKKILEQAAEERLALARKEQPEAPQKLEQLQERRKKFGEASKIAEAAREEIQARRIEEQILQAPPRFQPEEGEFTARTKEGIGVVPTPRTVDVEGTRLQARRRLGIVTPPLTMEEGRAEQRIPLATAPIDTGVITSPISAGILRRAGISPVEDIIAGEEIRKGEIETAKILQESPLGKTGLIVRGQAIDETTERLPARETISAIDQPPAPSLESFTAAETIGLVDIPIVTVETAKPVTESIGVIDKPRRGVIIEEPTRFEKIGKKIGVTKERIDIAKEEFRKPGKGISILLGAEEKVERIKTIRRDVGGELRTVLDEKEIRKLTFGERIKKTFLGAESFSLLLETRARQQVLFRPIETGGFFVLGGLFTTAEKFAVKTATKIPGVTRLFGTRTGQVTRKVTRTGLFGGVLGLEAKGVIEDPGRIGEIPIEFAALGAGSVQTEKLLGKTVFKKFAPPGALIQQEEQLLLFAREGLEIKKVSKKLIGTVKVDPKEERKIRELIKLQPEFKTFKEPPPIFPREGVRLKVKDIDKPVKITQEEEKKILKLINLQPKLTLLKEPTKKEVELLLGKEGARVKVKEVTKETARRVKITPEEEVKIRELIRLQPKLRAAREPPTKEIEILLSKDLTKPERELFKQVLDLPGVEIFGSGAVRLRVPIKIGDIDIVVPDNKAIVRQVEKALKEVSKRRVQRKGEAVGFPGAKAFDIKSPARLEEFSLRQIPVKITDKQKVTRLSEEFERSIAGVLELRKGGKDIGKALISGEALAAETGQAKIAARLRFLRENIEKEFPTLARETKLAGAKFAELEAPIIVKEKDPLFKRLFQLPSFDLKPLKFPKLEAPSVLVARARKREPSVPFKRVTPSAIRRQAAIQKGRVKEVLPELTSAQVIKFLKTGRLEAPKPPSPKLDREQIRLRIADPSDIRPSGLKPSKIRPSKIRPSKIFPSKIKPSKIAPSRFKPSKIPPSRIAPSRITPSRIAPSKIVPSKITPSRITPSRIRPSKILPSKIRPSKMVPSKFLPTFIPQKIPPPKKIPFPTFEGEKLIEPSVTKFKPRPARLFPGVAATVFGIERSPLARKAVARVGGSLGFEVRPLTFAKDTPRQRRKERARQRSLVSSVVDRQRRTRLSTAPSRGIIRPTETKRERRARQRTGLEGLQSSFRRLF